MKNNENKIALKTMAMKARVANIIRTELFPFSDDEYAIKYKGKKKFEDQDKIDIFNKIWPAYKEMNQSLKNYKTKRQNKAEIQRLREERKNLVLAK